MWILLAVLFIVFIFLLRKGYIKELLIIAAAIGLAVFLFSRYYFQIDVSFAVFNAACSFFIWYLILNILYIIVKKK